MAQAELFAEDYKVNLEIFEGPLDLLLYLIRREELEIYDIPIGRITEQYMQYLDLMRQLNLDVAGEFIVMAATLMVIKSRMMLPVDRRQAEEGADEETPPANSPSTRRSRRSRSTTAAGAPSSRRRRRTPRTRSRASTCSTSSPHFRRCSRASTRFRRRS